MNFASGKDAADYLRKRAAARRAIVPDRELNAAVAAMLDEMADMADPDTAEAAAALEPQGDNAEAEAAAAAKKASDDAAAAAAAGTV